MRGVECLGSLGWDGGWGMGDCRKRVRMGVHGRAIMRRVRLQTREEM
jgi:hypothetical protein